MQDKYSVEEPFLSVIVPTYNRADFLPGLIHSIQEQSFTSFEVLIIDDGSTDNTQAVVHKHGNDDPRIKYIFQENSERGAARNRGIKQSSGKYLLFVDSDDTVLPGYFQSIFDAAQETNAGLIACKFYLVRNNKKSKSDLKNLQQGFYRQDIVLKGNPFACNFAVNKNLKDLKLFNEDRKLSVMEDWLFLIQNTSKNQIYLIDQYAIELNDHDDRSMRTNHREIVKKRLNALNWIEENLKIEEEKKCIIRSNSYYFCAIHTRLGGDYREAKRFIKKAIEIDPINGMFAKAYLRILLRL